MSFDPEQLRKDFPVLHQKIYGKPFIYLDNAATTQKPQVVIDEISDFYSKINSNIHRGVHYLSEQATNRYEGARKKVQQFINAKHEHEIVFTKSTTEAVNLVAFSFGERFVKSGDEIIISEMEHHSNLVPWQMLCERKGAKLKVIPFNNKGELDIEAYQNMISKNTRLVAINHVSNSLGTINPVEKIIEIAHYTDIPVLIDGAQAIQHFTVDVQALDCEFYVFSGHKIYASNGIGVLYGKEQWLNDLPPYQGGGDMIQRVTFEKTTYNELPFKFEAGTSDYVAAASLGKAIDYLNEIGMKDIEHYENEVLEYATRQLKAIEGLTVYGEAENKASVLSFLLNDIHHFDTGMILDKMGIAVRTGTHCTEPVMQHFGIEGTVRASFCFYNTKNDVDMLAGALSKVVEMFN